MSLLYGSLKSVEGDCFSLVWCLKGMSTCMRQYSCNMFRIYGCVLQVAAFCNFVCGPLSGLVAMETPPPLPMSVGRSLRMSVMLKGEGKAHYCQRQRLTKSQSLVHCLRCAW